MLVWHDLLGLYDGHLAALRQAVRGPRHEIRDAVAAYADDVREGRFPEEEHTYGMPDEERSAFEAAVSPARRA